MKCAEDGRQEISNALRGISRFLLPHEVLIEIQRWIEASQPRMIWIQGILSPSYGSDLSLAAMHICEICLNAGIPCVSFFAKPSYDFATGVQLTQKEAATIAFLYTILTQLARLLPVQFEATKELNLSQFTLLGGNLDTVPVALGLIEKLIVHAPPLLIWVIDGMQLMESVTTYQYLTQFVQILQRQGTDRFSRVCFTTDGNSAVLNRTINPSERVDASRLCQAQPGQVVSGSASISTLHGPVGRQ